MRTAADVARQPMVGDRVKLENVLALRVIEGGPKGWVGFTIEYLGLDRIMYMAKWRRWCATGTVLHVAQPEEEEA